jgi:hypothetical protein
MNLPLLRQLLEASRAPAGECTCRDAYGPVPPYCDPCSTMFDADSDLSKELSLHVESLIAIARAAFAWRDESNHTGDANCRAGDHDSCTERDYLDQLRAAIDAAREGK